MSTKRDSGICRHLCCSSSRRQRLRTGEELPVSQLSLSGTSYTTRRREKVAHSNHQPDEPSISTRHSSQPMPNSRDRHLRSDRGTSPAVRKSRAIAQEPCACCSETCEPSRNQQSPVWSANLQEACFGVVAFTNCVLVWLLWFVLKPYNSQLHVLLPFPF
jgi:hypothetical protein